VCRSWCVVFFLAVSFAACISSRTLNRLNNISELELLYDWSFTAIQFFLVPSPLRLTAIQFFQLNTCDYVTSSLTRRRGCLLRRRLSFLQTYVSHIYCVTENSCFFPYTSSLSVQSLQSRSCLSSSVAV
jgi:hypothetical protein